MWFTTTEMYPLTVLKGGSPSSRCGQGHAPSEGSRGGSFLASFSFQWLQMPSVRGPILQVSVWALTRPPLCVSLRPNTPLISLNTPAIGIRAHCSRMDHL